MSAPASRHAARAALVIERCYEPDPRRQVAALLVLLKQTPAPAARRPTGSGREGDSSHGSTAAHSSRV